MEKIFIFAVIFMLIVVVAIFFFISQIKTGMGGDVEELRSKLDEVRTPDYTFLGLPVALLKAFLSAIASLTG